MTMRITTLLIGGMTDRHYLRMTHNYYAKGKNDDLLTTNPLYDNFGNTEKERMLLFLT